ncbi:MAG: xanthine dehydrogenase family protein molybdopterin-binding subunit [Gammaproteobacteria bacterium]|nr:xanthine dehydrogenase family protein molybdopterin-binding subunit [Gammaproteobacteria bacterium]
MISRRDFLQVSVASAGGLLVACRSLEPEAAGPAPATTAARVVQTPAPVAFGVYVEITPQNRVVIACPQSEMGQGVHDGLPKILAEELDADWSQVEVRLPWADDAFVNPITKRQRTANSESTMVYYDLLRKAGAAAREMLVAAAAAAWAVPAAECSTGGSRVVHAVSGRSASYGELAAAAAALPVPAEPRLKDPAQFRLIGRATPRKDTPAKTDGSAVFGIDVKLPGMQYAALRRSPAASGAKLAGFDREAALRLPGVVDTFEIPDGVAVVATSSWLARKAAEALELRFDESATQGLDSDAIRRRMLAALDDDAAARPGRPAFGGAPYDKAAALAAIAGAPRRLEWTYEVPFLAHAALEPLVATALVTEERCEVWAPTQQPDRSRDTMAQITGLPRERCRLNVTFLGGGFGRKWEVDFVRQAVQVANQAKGRPIKLTWTREQDFQHDRYRPAHIVRTRVGLGRDGAILGMHSRTTGISMWKYQGRPAIPGMGDPFALGRLINDIYRLPSRHADYVETPDPIPVGTWRSVSSSMNTFFSESALDDVAAATRRDPLELRLALLADARAQGVLKLAAEKAGWGAKLPRGRGRGIALSVGFDSYCAEVVEVAVDGDAVKIERIVCAFDCGTIVDPRNVEAQVEGGIVWGLSAARDGQVTFKDGIAEQTNFHTGPILRLNELPRIEVHLLRSSESPGGCGEASVPPVAPALASAIHAATGRRPRRLPLVAAGFTLA